MFIESSFQSNTRIFYLFKLTDDTRPAGRSDAARRDGR